MIEATYMDHQLSSSGNRPEPMDLSDVSTTGASPSPSDFTKLLPYSTSSSYPMQPDCTALLSPVSSVASPPMHQVVKQYAVFPDNAVSHLPSPPNSGKMFYPDWTVHFGIDQGPGPNDDISIPPEFYMQERCTPDPDSYLGGYSLVESQNQCNLTQHVHYFAPVPHLGSNAPPMGQSGPTHCVDSPSTLGTASEVSTPNPDPTVPAEAAKRVSRKRSVSTVPATKKEEADAEMKVEEASESEDSPSSRRNSVASMRKSKKKAAPPKKSTTMRTPVIDPEEHKNCHGELKAPLLQDYTPPEERCIFASRWEHRDKKGADMWDSIQEDYFREFDKEACKETLQMKLTRGRSKYIKWLPKDEELLLQAWLNMERSRYKALLDEFYKLGGSRNMLLSPNDIEIKAVADLRLEEEIYTEGISETEIRRRCRFLTGAKKSSRNGEERGISYSGASLFGRPVDEEEVICQVLDEQMSGKGARKSSAPRRKRVGSKSQRGPKKVKAELE